MTKYYFISYLGTNNLGALVYGNCTAIINNASVLEIGEMIQKKNGFKSPATLLCLKDLTKKEYEMLKGDEEQPR